MRHQLEGAVELEPVRVVGMFWVRVFERGVPGAVRAVRVNAKSVFDFTGDFVDHARVYGPGVTLLSQISSLKV